MIPFNDLTTYASRIKEPYLKKIGEIIDNGGSFILGEEVEKFEKAWADRCKAKYCVGVSSGADAIYLSLMARGIGPGKIVVTQGNAYNATVTSILRTGAEVRFVDINEDMTMNIDKIPYADAVVSGNLYGKMNKEITGTMVVQDCAHTHGISTEGAYSFYPTKILGAFGDAGAVVTNDRILYDEIKARRDLGKVDGEFEYLGYNMRMDPFQAVALQLQLDHLDSDMQERDVIAERYDEALEIEHDSERAYHLYVVQSDYRDSLKARLLSEGIETAIHYPVPVYKQPFWTGDIPDCPVTDKVCGEVLSLPFFIGMTRDQQDKVIENL